MQNAVHVGEPTRRYGFSSCTLRIAALRLAAMLKSHGTPFSSAVVRSNANPAENPRLGCLLAMDVTLGGEYTSLTILLTSFMSEPSEKRASAVACGPVRSSQSSWSPASSGSRLRLKSGMSTDILALELELELAVPWGFSSILLLPPWRASAFLSKSFRLSIASPSVAIYSVFLSSALLTFS